MTAQFVAENAVLRKGLGSDASGQVVPGRIRVSDGEPVWNFVILRLFRRQRYCVMVHCSINPRL